MRKLHPGMKNDLDSLKKRYDININRKFHNALLDSFILSIIFLNVKYINSNSYIINEYIKDL